MTPRERWLAAVRMQPVDRLPFWPKLNAAYPPAQVGPWSAMTLDQFHREIGSDRHIGLPAGFARVHKAGDLVQSREGNVSTARYIMPHSELRAVRHFDAASQAWHPVEFPVKRREDIPLLTQWWRDIEVVPQEDQVLRARALAAETAQDAVLTANIGTSGLMEWVEHLAGVENAHYFLADYPDEVLPLLDAIQSVLLRQAEIALRLCPADLFYLTENTSTSLVSPDQYRRLCFPHLDAIARRARDAGKLMVLHMCGLLKGLLPDLEKLPVAAFEAFTSPTLGNTTLLDGRALCPTKCLIGGTNAMLWLRPAGEIIAQIRRDLDALPHHRGIVVTSAGVMPPRCPPQVIREVCNAVKAYSARC
jgi:uroporphyrinogen-III decarboxylase